MGSLIALRTLSSYSMAFKKSSLFGGFSGIGGAVIAQGGGKCLMSKAAARSGAGATSGATGSAGSGSVMDDAKSNEKKTEV